MRKIIFRGKRPNSGKWITGSLVQLFGFSYILNDEHKTSDCSTEVILETVSQFTGLTDKDGNEIYDGDIIEVLDSQNRPCRHIVGYCDNHGGYVQYLFLAEGIKVEPFECGLLCQQYITEQGKYIIGNIYDNPELITNR